MNILENATLTISYEVAVCLADSGLLEVGFGLRKEGMWIVEATAVCFSTSVFFSPNFCN